MGQSERKGLNNAALRTRKGLVSDKFHIKSLRDYDRLECIEPSDAEDLLRQLAYAFGKELVDKGTYTIKGWTCKACKVFNGEEKGPHSKYRSCGEKKD